MIFLFLLFVCILYIGILTAFFISIFHPILEENISYFSAFYTPYLTVIGIFFFWFVDTEAGVGTAPGVYLREDPICGTQLENQSELRAPTADRAAYYLDAALASRAQGEVQIIRVSSVTFLNVWTDVVLR